MGKLLNYNYFTDYNYRYVTDIYEYYNPYSGPGRSNTQELKRLITKGEFHPLYTGRLTTRNLWDEHLYGDDCLVDNWTSRYIVSMHIKCTGSKSFETDWTGSTLSGDSLGITYTRNDVFYYRESVTLNVTISNLRVWDKTETNVFDDTTKLSASELIGRGFDLSWSSSLGNSYPIISSSTFSCNLRITGSPTPAGYYPRNTQYSSSVGVRWGYNDKQWLFIYWQNVHRTGS